MRHLGPQHNLEKHLSPGPCMTHIQVGLNGSIYFPSRKLNGSIVDGLVSTFFVLFSFTIQHIFYILKHHIQIFLFLFIRSICIFLHIERSNTITSIKGTSFNLTVYDVFKTMTNSILLSKLICYGRPCILVTVTVRGVGWPHCCRPVRFIGLQ